MTIDIVLAGNEDIQDIVPLKQQSEHRSYAKKGHDVILTCDAAQERVRGMLKSGVDIFIARDGENTVGYMAGFAEGSQYFLADSFVLGPYRIEGAGVALVLALKDHAARLGCTSYSTDMDIAPDPYKRPDAKMLASTGQAGQNGNYLR